MPNNDAFIWETSTPRPSRARRTVPPQVAASKSDTGRISLREAEERFGVRAATLRTWARKGTIDGIQAGGPRGDRWMVIPESIAHHLSRRKPQVSTSRSGSPRKSDAGNGSSMLVPRDAWDKLMDQLGNLHEAGLLLAEARERAAKAETEAVFLRERLSDMRTERDQLRADATTPAHDESSPSRARWWTPWRRNG